MNKEFSVYCSKHKAIVPFVPKLPNIIKWYNCGPTVYGPAHLGHARNYVTLDIVRRIMQDYFKYKVEFGENITDIDDKIIKKSNELGISTRALTIFYEDDFFSDMKQLNVLPPTEIFRATEVIEKIVKFIERLVDSGKAYKQNGSVYFDTQLYRQDHTYPQLGNVMGIAEHNQLLNEGEGSWQSSVSSSEKRSPGDFALWKQSKENEPFWESPFGPGRPGWHIECSVMATEMYNEGTDIHSGGEDLKFPHHDNEIAQSETYLDACHHGPRDTNWVNYWLHSGHLNIDKMKMSKSLKNFTTVKEALKLATARQLRVLFLMHRYYDSFDYSANALEQAKQIEKKLVEFLLNASVFLRENTPVVEKKADEENQTAQSELNQILNFYNVPNVNELNKIIPHGYSVKVDEQIPTAGAPSSTGQETTEKSFEILDSAQQRVDTALRNAFDTPTVLDTLLQLVRQTNTAISQFEQDGQAGLPRQTEMCQLVQKVRNYIIHILGVFGVEMDVVIDSSASSKTLEDGFNEMCKFRDFVRTESKNSEIDAPTLKKRLLEQCDELRNKSLPPLGIRLEDRKLGEPSVWKMVDPVEFEREQARKEEERQKKEEQKKRLEQAKKEKEARASISPNDMFKNEMEDLPSGERRPRYSAFDDNGIPTVDIDGKEIDEKTKKHLLQQWQKQKKVYENYLKKKQ
ncbi:putative Cysteine--tRNA ligase [Blattamonas nauphoetae]|uniref:cysteine--tRNA ligase n=1 Tax=Blattamonas nauphoetae TaxID=2049346 RepID=A0ABQ9Y1Q4_9EUKA|nr:putative Cysteine--tRNA ligase [Blattamonas nauphoetae]